MWSPRLLTLTPGGGAGVGSSESGSFPRGGDLINSQEEECTQIESAPYLQEEGTLLQGDGQEEVDGGQAQQEQQQQQPWGRLLPLKRGEAHIKLFPRLPLTRMFLLLPLSPIFLVFVYHLYDFHLQYKHAISSSVRLASEWTGQHLHDWTRSGLRHSAGGRAHLKSALPHLLPADPGGWRPSRSESLRGGYKLQRDLREPSCASHKGR